MRELTFGLSATPMAPEASNAITVDLLNFDADFGIAEESATEVTFVDLTAPVDQASTVRVGVTPIANIFSGTGIDPTLASSVKSGKRIHAQVRMVGRITDTTDATHNEYVPVTATVTITVPDNSAISDGDVLFALRRAIGAVAYGGTTEALAAGVTRLRRGVLDKD